MIDHKIEESYIVKQKELGTFPTDFADFFEESFFNDAEWYKDVNNPDGHYVDWQCEITLQKTLKLEKILVFAISHSYFPIAGTNKCHISTDFFICDKDEYIIRKILSSGDTVCEEFDWDRDIEVSKKTVSELISDGLAFYEGQKGK